MVRFFKKWHYSAVAAAQYCAVARERVKTFWSLVALVGWLPARGVQEQKKVSVPLYSGLKGKRGGGGLLREG